VQPGDGGPLTIRALHLASSQSSSAVLALNLHRTFPQYRAAITQAHAAQGCGHERGAMKVVTILGDRAVPARPGTGQARARAVTPAAAAALATRTRWLRDRNISLPAADQTRDCVTDGDGPLARPSAPGTRRLRISSLRLAHLSLSHERQAVKDGNRDCLCAKTQVSARGGLKILSVCSVE